MVETVLSSSAAIEQLRQAVGPLKASIQPAYDTLLDRTNKLARQLDAGDGEVGAAETKQESTLQLQITKEHARSGRARGA
jgi:hypothetical protein